MEDLYFNHSFLPDLPFDQIPSNFSLEAGESKISSGLWVIKYYGVKRLLDLYPDNLKKKFKNYGLGEIYLYELAKSGSQEYVPEAVHDQYVKHKFRVLKDAKLEPFFDNMLVFDGQITRSILFYLNRPNFFPNANKPFVYQFEFLEIFDKFWGSLLIKAIYTNDSKDWAKIGLRANMDFNIDFYELKQMIESAYRGISESMSRMTI